MGAADGAGAGGAGGKLAAGEHAAAVTRARAEKRSERERIPRSSAYRVRASTLAEGEARPIGYDEPMRGARAWLAATAAFAIAGCSLLTETGGLAGPADPSSNEGGTLAASDAMTDAAAAADGDAAVLVDSSPPSTDCSGKHFFCTTFDKGALSDEWDVVAPGNGTIDRNMAAAVSLPFSLLVTHPAGNPGATPILTKTLPSPAGGGDGLRCRFQYRRDVVESAGVLVVLMIDFSTATSEHLFVEIKDGLTEGRVYLEAKQQDGGVLADFPTIPTFSAPLGTWASVEWTLDLRNLSSTLKSDAKVIDQRPIPHIDVENVTSGKLSLGLGNFAEPASPWQVRFDDFVCDVLPP
jgi:hypothetical protein